MFHRLEETIVAIASPSGGAARGIVRLSGPNAVSCLAQVFEIDPQQAELHSIGRPSVVRGSVRLGDSVPLTCDAYIWPDHRSYTGDPVVELHLLGSQALLEMVLTTFCSIDARLAEPGEFTLRAFLNHRIDLTQAEAVLGVIDANNQKQLDTALAQLAGGLARQLHELREELLDLLADLEAGLDFADEELPFLEPKQLEEQLNQTAQTLASLATQMKSRKDSTTTIKVVLLGRPNVGKSSLFNTLAGSQQAMVHAMPGTTRDYLSVALELNGVSCQLIDTAGVEAVPEEQGTQEVSHAMQKTTSRQSAEAQVQLLCIDSTHPLSPWERTKIAAPSDVPRLILLTKTDAPHHTDCEVQALETSSFTGKGIEELRLRLRDAVLLVNATCEGAVASTAIRCSQSLRLASDCLEHAQRTVASGGGEELVAADIRHALDELGVIVGAVYTDDLLDRVFSRFCIGK